MLAEVMKGRRAAMRSMRVAIVIAWSFQSRFRFTRSTLRLEEEV